MIIFGQFVISIWTRFLMIEPRYETVLTQTGFILDGGKYNII